MLFIRIWPFWDPLRTDPRFDGLVRRMNFPEIPVSETATKQEEAVKTPIEKVAVLPFTSISSEPSEDWFVDGMTDALITQLGKIKALTVISRTSAMQYKDISKPILEIAQDLGVDGLIEGSVTRAGNDVQITARLINGRTDERIWGDFFQGTFTNILALQSQVTLAIAQEIEAALTPDEQKRIARTEAVNPEAYEAYLLGRHYLNKGLEPDIEVAIKYFKRALEIDSTYAIACTGLADAYTAFGNQNIRSPEDTWPNARTAAEKALAIDEGLAEAHTALAKVKYLFDWDWSSAEREFRLALEINPSSAGTHLGYSRFLEALERYDEALSQIERALELDPHSMIVKFFRCSILYRAGWKNEAIGLAKSEVDSDPDQASIWWYFLLANFYAGQGTYEEALALLQTQINLMEGNVADELGFIGYLYGRLGRKSEALKQIEKLDELAAKGRYVSPVTRSWIYIGLDDKDKAFECLDKGYQTHSVWMVQLKVWFFFDTLRDDPRFKDLLQRMKFPE
jgi:TolB-like protein